MLAIPQASGFERRRDKGTTLGRVPASLMRRRLILRKFLAVLAMSMLLPGPGFAQQTGGAAEGAGATYVTTETVGTVLFFTLIAAVIVGVIASANDDDSTVTHE
jgi:hypothetical protein